MRIFLKITAFLLLAQVSFGGPAYPLKVLTGQHYLVDQNNNPVFVHADSPWSMFVQLNIADAETYISNRANLQVNGLIVNLIEHKFCDNPPFNVYGVAPFTRKTKGGAYWDFSSINPDYFTNVDNQIQLAAKYGMTVFLDPDFLGVNGGDAGWYADMNNNSSKNLSAYGQYIGNRYKSFPNIVWMQGGDYTAGNANSVLNSVAQGIASMDPNHVQLAEGFQSPGFTFTGSWNVINTVYEYRLYNFPGDIYSEYEANPVSPVVLIESNYEGEDNSGIGHLATDHDCRNQAYYAAFTGSCGEFFGNHWIWQFISGWTTQQFTPTSTTILTLPALFASRPWYSCVPDTTHAAIISGYGTLGQNTYCPALIHGSGATMMAYVPGNSGSPSTLMANMSKVSGSTANVWWYNALDGSVITVGNYPTAGTQGFTSPDSGEWVLVIDDASQNFGAPGVAPATPPIISSFSAVPASIGIGGSSTLSWTVSGNPAPGLSISPGIGPVTGSSISVSPSATTTYTLTATNSAGVTSAQTILTVTTGPDTSPPSIPTNITVTFTSSSQINLAWNPSIDNVGVAGYRIFRNGVQVGTSVGTLYSDAGLAPSTTYTYNLAAFDAAGNVSAQSAPFTAATQPLISSPTFIQSAASLNDASGTSISQTFSAPNNSGNLIIVVTSWGNSVDTPSVSDTLGNTYVAATYSYSSVADQSLAIYYARNVKAGDNNVTVKFGGSHAWRRILIGEYAGLDPISPLDGAVSNQGSATTATDSVTSGAVVTSSAGDLIFGAVENFNVDGTISAGTGFALRSFVMDKGVIETAFEARIAASAGSTAATFTFAHADPYIAQVVAFHPGTSTDTQAPSVPTNLSAVATSSSQINLTWSPSSDNVGVAGYQVFRNGVMLGTSLTDSYSDTGLAASSTYTYTVTAFDAAGNVSAQSASASTTTLTASIPPAISVFNASPTVINKGSSSTLSWTVSGSPAPTLWITPGVDSVSGTSILVQPIATTTYTLNASNTAGNASAQVLVTVNDTQPPSVPTNLTALAVSPSQIHLAWSNSTDNVGVAGYQIFRNGVLLTTSPTNSYSDTGLAASTTYTYTVTAFDAAGNVSAASTLASATTQTPGVAPVISMFSASPSTINSGGSSTLSWSVSGTPAPTLWISPGIGAVSDNSIIVQPGSTTTYTLSASNNTGNASAQVSITVNDTLAPSVPTNLSAVAISPSQINLTWSKSTDNVGVAGYQIFRNGVSVGNSTTNGYSDTGLSPSTSYTYAAAAFDSAGNTSAQSAPVSAATLAQTSAPGLVQSANKLDDSLGTTIAQSFASANAAGNLIAVVVSWGNSTATPTMTDSLGNTYVMATSAYSASGDQSLAIFYGKNTKAGTNTLTVNFGGSHAWRRILIAEYQGLNPVNPFDKAISNQASASQSTDSVTSGTVITSASGDLIFGAVENYNVNGTVSAGTGFTLQNSVMEKGVIETAFEDRVAVSAGSVAATFTFSHSDSYIAQMVAFRAASSP